MGRHCICLLWRNGEKRPGSWFNIKMTSYQDRKSHCGDKTILRPSYLHNCISYTGKTTSLYWIGPCIFAIAHDDVIKGKHFPRYWPFVRGIHRSPVNAPHKCQWRGVLMFYLIGAWTNGWVKKRDAGDLRRHRAHYDVTVTNVGSSYAGDHRQRKL